MNFLTLQQVLDIHAEVIRLHGGDPSVHDEGLVDSAVAQPQATYGGDYLNPTLPDMAAALGFSLVSNHGFKDGNKRVGFTATDVFLRLNGHKISAPVDEAEGIILSIASGTMTREQFADWLRQNIAPLGAQP